MREVADQPPPVHRPDHVPVWDMVVADMQSRRDEMTCDEGFGACVDRVVADMRERDRVGRERYGTPLTIHNGRDHLVDLYQELLDSAAYSKAAIMEGGPLALHGVYQRVLADLVLVRTLIHELVLRRNA